MTTVANLVPKPRYEDVRLPDGSIAFQIDRQRAIVRIVRKRVEFFIDLTILFSPIEQNERLCYSSQASADFSE